MNRHQRQNSRKQGGKPDFDRIFNASGIPEAERQRFLNWLIARRWAEFKQERTDKRIMTENEIKSLGIRLPNGTMNKDYETFFTLPLDRISHVSLEGAEELGLTFAIAGGGRCSLSGRPEKSGDFNLTLRYRVIDSDRPSSLNIPIAFNPDPRKLWNDIPTNPNVLYYKEDSDAEYVMVEDREDDLPRKDIVAASQRGRSHAHEGKPRDDHFALYHCDKSDWYILAVADGAGSAKYSREGSRIACNTVVEHCKALLLDNPGFENAICDYVADRDDKEKRTEVTRQVIDIVYKGAVEAHQAIKKVTEANPDIKLRDLATTLMFAICKRYHFGWFIASFWVGDGAMAIYDEEKGSVKLLGTPDEGEFSGQTRFLTMPEIFRDPEVVAKRLRMAIVPDFTALFLMTDGVSDPMFETDRNLTDPAKWKELYEKIKTGFPEDDIPGVDLSDDNEAAAPQLLRWLDFWSPGNHDDRTIAILY